MLQVGLKVMLWWFLLSFFEVVNGCLRLLPKTHSVEKSSSGGMNEERQQLMMKRKVRRIYEEPPDNNGDKDVMISIVVRLFTLSTKRAYDQSHSFPLRSHAVFLLRVTRIYTFSCFVIYVLYGKEVMMRRKEDREKET